MTVVRPAQVRRGVLSIALAAVFWGTGGAAAALLYRGSGLGPVAVSFWRFAFGAAMLAGARPLLRAGRLREAVRGRWRLVLATGAGLACSQCAYFTAVRGAGVTIATVVTLGSSPVLVALGGRVALGERLSRIGTGSVAAAVLGVVLLAGTPHAGDAPLAGTCFALLSAVAYSAVTLVVRAGRADPYDMALAGFATGTLWLLPLALVAGLAWRADSTPGTVGLLVYLGAVPTAAAYGLFFAGLRVVRAATSAVLALIEVLTAAAIGVGALGERLTVAGAAGGLLLVCSVLLLAAGP
jgi:DME family drug/metabolite transporter